MNKRRSAELRNWPTDHADQAPHARSQWVDYQRSIGIGRIYLYDHLSPVRPTHRSWHACACVGRHRKSAARHRLGRTHVTSEDLQPQAA